MNVNARINEAGMTVQTVQDDNAPLYRQIFSGRKSTIFCVILAISSPHDIIMMIVIFFTMVLREGTKIADTKHGRLYRTNL